MITRGIAMTLLGLLALACGGGGGEEAQTEGGPAEGAGYTVPADSAATINGTITFTGTPAANEAIDMSEEPTCAEANEAPTKETVVVGSGGELANVFVYVKEGLPDVDWGTPSEGVTIDQHGCHYVPHVMGVQTGQPLIIKNSDGILHNINTQPTANQGFNISQPVAMETERTFSAAEVMIPVKCDVHGWMEAFIGVQDHPYMAVSGADGSFSLANLPPGTYTIEAWHELYGTQTQSVTVSAQQTADIAFTFSAETANAVPLGEPLVLHQGH